MSASTTASSYPAGFLWGAATAGHQVEGDDTTSDTSFLEHTEPSLFAEPAGPACRSQELWEQDLDLVAALGLTAYRFSVEWAKIEPVRGEIDAEALDRYEAMVDGCRARGIAPVITLSHFTAPHWFAAAGSWLAEEAAELFAAHCRRVAERLGDRVAAAVTLNEPNLEQVLQALGALPASARERKAAMLAAAAERAGVSSYRSANVIPDGELEAFREAFTRAHRAGREALKAVRPDLPVGVSIAISDEVAVPGGEASRDADRAALYEHWLQVAREDDFIGVQNYEQRVHGPDGVLPPPEDVPRNDMGSAVAPDSLAGAVRYAHDVAGVPVLVTEHGLASDDDTLRARFIPESLDGLAAVLAEGVPVLGYCHWTLIDNFEWISGYGTRLGLHTVDRTTFDRTPKPSAHVYRDYVAARRAAVVG